MKEAIRFIALGVICLFVNPQFSDAAVPDPVATFPDLSGVVAKARPSLVKIINDGVVDSPGTDPRELEIANTKEGAGFFIDESGYILTNFHVIDGAGSLTVITTDRKEFDAEVVGADAVSDIALLRIRPDFKVAAADIGDSSKVRPGQWVVALGNPLGIEFFASAGIVAGIGPPGPNYTGFFDFIQAAITFEPGNSGGPLVNLDGEVVGINTSHLGSAGFSIPINRAMEMVPSLIEKGHIAHGTLGITAQPLDRDLALRLGIGNTRGALISGMKPGGPAASSGLRKRDVIVSFDGDPVDNDRALQRLEYMAECGSTVKLIVMRDGRLKPVEVRLGSGEETAGRTSEDTGSPFKLKPIPDSVAKKYGIEDSSGLMVLRVMPGSTAFRGGLRFGDVVREIECRMVNSESDFFNVYSNAEPGSPLLIQVVRGSRPIYITIKKEGTANARHVVAVRAPAAGLSAYFPDHAVR